MRDGGRHAPRPGWTFARRWRVLKRRAARWFSPPVRTADVEAHLAGEVDGRGDAQRPDGSAYDH